MKEIKIQTEFIKLDQFLKYAGLVQTGGEAKLVIADGMVEVNGQVAYERGKKIRVGDKIKIEDYSEEFFVI